MRLSIRAGWPLGFIRRRRFITNSTVILVVDDDSSVTASLSLLFKQRELRSLIARSPKEALDLLATHKIDLVLQDMNFTRTTGGGEGLELLREIRHLRPELPVILITAWGSISLAVEGVKAGATDFITKPWSNTQLIQSIETALSLAANGSPAGEKATLSRSQLDEQYDLGLIVGEDPRLLRVLERIVRVSPTDASVLITGESGTGKELIAETIHRNSRRKDGPFVKVNLGGVSSTLFESEMFGHVRGAFTDARESRKGRFDMADGGTIFLDEIGETDLNSQVKLLRVLQDRTFEPLGSSKPRTVDLRVVSATNRVLPQLVTQGRFREDLLYRLNLIAVDLPPLRERRGDIERLTMFFLQQCGATYGRDPLRLTRRAIEWLKDQPWPGNIRQLRQVVERAVLFREQGVLELEDLEALAELENRSAKSQDLPPAGSMTLDQIEKAMIEKCLRHYEGNVSRVAEALGLSRAALYRRFEKYGLAP